MNNDAVRDDSEEMMRAKGWRSVREKNRTKALLLLFDGTRSAVVPAGDSLGVARGHAHYKRGPDETV